MPGLDELVAELREVVRRLHPDWTSGDANDPGVTLAELFAFLGEELLYRVDQVPERVRPRLKALGSRLARPWTSPGGAVSPADAGLKRVRYFPGQLLSAGDFTAEQQYLREKQKIRNRLLVGSGVVSGREVSVGAGTVTVSPGMAIDRRGNEVIVGSPVDVALPPGRKSVILSLEYRETETDPVPAGSGMQASRIQEGFELSFAAAPSANGIVVAKLVRRSGRWSIEKRSGGPRVKRGARRRDS